MTLKSQVKRVLSTQGVTIARRDPLEEQIPEVYFRSPFLPPICRFCVSRLFHFRKMLETVKDIPGDIVECGVSIGYGILYWSLLCELLEMDRAIWGFDSFHGFPPAGEADKKVDGTFQTEEGEFASTPELVMKVLQEGGVSDALVARNVRLVKGYFNQTLCRFNGSIALLHLDCDLYDSYRTCLEQLYYKVVPGGIIAFDEYEDAHFPGAKQAVDDFFGDKPEKPQLYHQLQYTKYFVVKT